MKRKLVVSDLDEAQEMLIAKGINLKKLKDLARDRNIPILPEAAIKNRIRDKIK